MKTFFATLLLVLSSSALGAPVTGLGTVDGVVIYDFQRTASLTLEEGRIFGCEAPESLTIFTCSMEGGQFTITDGDKTSTIQIEKLVYIASDRTDFSYEQFIYKGAWTKVVDGISLDTPVSLTLIRYAETPEKLRGYIQMSDYDYSFQLRARQR